MMSKQDVHENTADRAYPYRVETDEGGYFITFPDLPGCMTQVEHAAEIGPAAEEIRTLWLETARERGITIPPPAAPASHSGRFVVRVPRALHRDLAESAANEGVSLNQYVIMLLSRTDALARVERLLTDGGHQTGSSSSPGAAESDGGRRKRGARLSLVGDTPS